VISFVLPPGAPQPPIVGALNGAFHVETFHLQLDLHRLLVWAHDNAVDLLQLQAAPPRLDDVFGGSAAT
jgi:ABC-2 type transport system ATP-binding protein